MIYRYYESNGATRSASSERQGVAVISRGVTRRFLRQSEAYVKAPNSKLYTKVKTGLEASVDGGLVFEQGISCRSPQNAWIGGTTGWTLTNNSGVIALDTAEPYLFDGTVQTTQQTLRFTAGNPNTTGAVAQSPVSLDLAAVEEPNLRIFRRDDSGVVLQWACYSSRAAKWYNPATPAFDSAAAVYTDLDACATTTDFEAFAARIYKGVTVSPDTLFMRIRQGNGGTVSRVNNVGYASFDTYDYLDGVAAFGGPWPVDTLAAQQRREPSGLMLRCEDGMVNRSSGVVMVRVRCDGVNSADSHILCVGSIVGGCEFLRIWSDAGAHFYATGGLYGSTVDASKAVAFAPGSTYVLAVRYVGATLSLFVDGVKGTDATLADPLFETDTYDTRKMMSFGGRVENASDACWTGPIDPIATIDGVLTDDDIASLSRAWAA